MPHEGHFLESDVPIAAYIFNSPLHGMILFHSLGYQAKLMIYSSLRIWHLRELLDLYH